MMTNDVFLLIQLAVLLGLSLLAGLFFFRRKPAADVPDLPLRARPPSIRQALMSAAHARPLAPAAGAAGTAPASPLVEAEVYLIYGRKNVAQKVLDAAMREGLVTPEEVVRFWTQHQAVRGAL